MIKSPYEATALYRKMLYLGTMFARKCYALKLNEHHNNFHHWTGLLAQLWNDFGVSTVYDSVGLSFKTRGRESRHVRACVLLPSLACTWAYLHMFACEHLCPCKCGSTSLFPYTCVRVWLLRASRQHSLQGRGQGYGISCKQEWEWLRVRQTLPWVIMFESDQALLGVPKILLLQL